ncbi:MAG: T9SS type A sorting domain-containing protein [Bacteroidetes bacterium]|nr:T9SS type A sorting domain-containing protein [Bacteroidota bacterium]
MKKIITLAVILFCFAANSYSQTVYGGDFEHWKFISQHNYYEPDSSLFGTLNILDTIPTPSGVTVHPCDTAHSGNYSVRLVTGYISLVAAVIPGVIGTIKIDWATSQAKLGIPYPYGTAKPTRFTGWYKSYPLNGDSSAAVVLLSKWNNTNHRRDTLAYSKVTIHGTVTSWTQFDVAITYRDHTTQPDSLTMLMLSCAGFNATYMLGSVGQVGSMAMFDDINLTDVSGVPLKVIPSVNVKLSPNPASQLMKIEMGSNVTNGSFDVYDAQAKLIRQYPVNGNVSQISVSNLSAGSYFYKLTENNKLLNSGTFMVTR